MKWGFTCMDWFISIDFFTDLTDGDTASSELDTSITDEISQVLWQLYSFYEVSCIIMCQWSRDLQMFNASLQKRRVYKFHTPAEEDFEIIKLISNGAYA